MAGIITHIAFYVGWPKAWAAFNLAKEIYKKINIQTIIIFGDKLWIDVKNVELK